MTEEVQRQGGEEGTPPGAPTPCLVCGRAVSDEPTTCPRCGVEAHSSCWDYSGGCPRLDCRRESSFGKPPTPGERASLVRVIRAWAWLTRMRWAAFLVTALLFTLLPAPLLLGPPGPTIAALVLFVVGVLLLGWGLSLPLGLFLGWMARRRLGAPLRTPAGAWVDLPEGTPLPREEAGLLRLVEGWPRVYLRLWGGLTLAILLLDTRGPFSSQVGWIFLCWGGMGWALSRGLGVATRRRLFLLVSLARRLGETEGAPAPTEEPA